MIEFIGWAVAAVLVAAYLYDKKKQERKKPEPVPTPPVKQPPIDYGRPRLPQEYVSHWNSQSWHGQGISLVMSTNPFQRKVRWVRIEGMGMAKHGSQDKGRDIWTIRDPGLTGLQGSLEVGTVDGTVYEAQTTDFRDVGANFSQDAEHEDH